MPPHPPSRSASSLSIVLLGLSVTSSWMNAQAVHWRAMMRALAARGHQVVFLERDLPLFDGHRDESDIPYGAVTLYADLDELRREHSSMVRQADLVILGSFLPEGVAVAQWALEQARGTVAFWDLDPAITLQALAGTGCAYMTPQLLAALPLVLVAGTGPVPDHYRRLGAERVASLLPAVDPVSLRPDEREPLWEMGFMGRWTPERHGRIERFLLQPARSFRSGRFVLAGALYPQEEAWPANVQVIGHLAPRAHRHFHASLRYALNLTDWARSAVGHLPPLRLFEAMACGTPVITDPFPGLEEVFTPAHEILVARDGSEVSAHLLGLSDTRRRLIAQAGRERVLEAHTGRARVRQLEDVLDQPARQARGTG